MTPNDPSPKIEALVRVIETVRRLRAPGGCPWDQKQTHHSLRKYLIEEAFETVDAIDPIDSPEKLNDERLKSAFREEMGDVLLQILLHSEIASETQAFDFYDVAAALNAKLIFRHPHVFGDVKDVNSADQVVVNWEKLKAKEKELKNLGTASLSVLDGIPKGLPAMSKAAQVIAKVTKVGFQWNDMKGPLSKLDEEISEMKHEVLEIERVAQLAASASEASIESLRRKLENEIGDVLFTVCNVAHLMKIDPDHALRSTLQKFEGRFRHVEKRLAENGTAPEKSTLEEMDRYWDEAKKIEKL